MTLTNVTKKQNPHKCEGFAVVVTETNKPATFYPITVKQKFGKPTPVVSNTVIVLALVIS
jgi:hypothetical protein